MLKALVLWTPLFIFRSRCLSHLSPSQKQYIQNWGSLQQFWHYTLPIFNTTCSTFDTENFTQFPPAFTITATKSNVTFRCWQRASLARAGPVPFWPTAPRSVPPPFAKPDYFLYQKTGDFNKTNQTQRPSLHGDEVKFSSCGTSEDPLAAAHAHRAEGCSSDQFNSPGIQQQTNSLCENLFVIDTKTDYTTEWTLGKLWVVLCCSSSPILIHIHLGKILDRLLTNLKQHRSWYNT